MLGDRAQALPDPCPLFVAEGGAQVSYAPGHPFAEVQFVVHGTRTSCDAGEAWDLVFALMRALGPVTTQTPERRASGAARRSGHAPNAPQENP